MIRSLELLSPAKDADTGIEAIKHGADAVYIGPPNHGARKSAANSLEDIKRVVEYAHLFNAKVYATVNTIIYDREIRNIEKMVSNLYDIGLDALIVQDMAFLRMDIPPIELHASTQCDIRTPEKALFLQEAGFSQLVLARELSLEEIRNICRVVSIPVEVFVHGALCMSYSGRCGAGFACQGRSGNRGECPQICRQSFTLRDASGKIIAKDKYLLSLKDLNRANNIPDLINAGVSSFKIEGRLKETGYVKNITAYYSDLLNAFISDHDRDFKRSSEGLVTVSFSPDPEKSFNRGFTSYRLSGDTNPGGMASLNTPKSLGERISEISSLRPGDGISFFNSKGEYEGILVNGIKNGRIIGNKPFTLPSGTEIRRTSSIEWKKLMAGETARRVLPVIITLGKDKVTACTETVSVSLPIGLEGSKAIKPQNHRAPFDKLGNTPFILKDFIDETPDTFYPVSELTALRRNLIEALEKEIENNYHRQTRRPENKDFPYPVKNLDYRDNVANTKSRTFYKDHQVDEIQPALETGRSSDAESLIVMSSKYCILKELGLCLKNQPKIKMPLSLTSGNLKLLPEFDCAKCEMNLRYSSDS